jgi:hypothetical protein
MNRLITAGALAVFAVASVAAQQPATPPLAPSMAPQATPPPPAAPAPQPTRGRQGQPAAPTPAPAQRPTPLAVEPPAPAAPRGGGPMLPNPPVNVRVDLTITDTYAGSPSKKTVTMLIANGGGASIRTNMQRLTSNAPVLNVDGQLTVYPGNVVKLFLTFNYWPGSPANSPSAPPPPGEVTESANVLLMDGKTMVISQSADPTTDRKVTVEVTTTVVK